MVYPILRLRFCKARPFLFLCRFVRPKIPISFCIIRCNEAKRSSPRILVPLQVFFLRVHLICIRCVRVFRRKDRLVFLLLGFQRTFMVVRTSFFSHHLVLRNSVMGDRKGNIQSFCSRRILVLRLARNRRCQRNMSRPIRLRMRRGAIRTIMQAP